MIKNQSPHVFRIDRNGVKRLIIIFMTLFFQGLIMFLAAGNIRIERIWLFLLFNLAYLILSFMIILIYFPERADIINQRGKFNKDTKKWDIIVVSTISPVSLIVVPAVIGFDLGRFHWSDIPMGYFYGLLPVYLISQAFGQWALLANPHFEPTVRIQTDRDHHVAQNGPYQFMRHPGYLSFIFSSFITPIMLGSFVALLPTIIIIALFIVRTVLEDNTLKTELAGYKEYAEKVRFRLIPYVW